MEVFIENEAGSKTKNIFDEKTLIFQKSVEVSSPYPFPYGFLLRTTSGDGDNLDCFILTRQPLTTGQIIDAEPIALLEMYEDGELDHKVIARLEGEAATLDEATKEAIVAFLNSVFSHIPGKRMVVGDFKGADAALDLIGKLSDPS